jgi:F0F1-type ATP synthase membrane subunit b/b'
MSLSEKVQQLNREIGSAMEHAMDQVRQEVSQWLRSSNEEILGRLAELRPEIPESFVAHDDLAPAVHSAAEELSAQAREEIRQEAERQSQQAVEQARQQAQEAQEEARRQARRGGAAELCSALASIDRARSQAEILNALLQEAGRYASRAAILLLRGGEVRAWAGTGFGEADASLRQVSLGMPADGSWSHVFQGQGPAHLSASDCALLASRIEAPLPRHGVLVPMILRDRVAAAVYADRTDGEPLAAEALQVLSYTAALAIESLPFRERASTSTLAALSGEPPAPVEAPTEARETDEEPTSVETPTLADTEATEVMAGAPAVETPEDMPADTAEDAQSPDTLRTEALPSIGGWEKHTGEDTLEDTLVGTTEVTEVEVEAEPEPSPWTSPAVEETSPYAVEAVEVEAAAYAPDAADIGDAGDLGDTAVAMEEAPAEPAAYSWGEPVPEDSGTPTQQVDLRSLNPSAASAAAPQASPDATVLLQRPNLREVVAPAPEPVEERPALTPPTPIRPLAPVAPPPPAPPAPAAPAPSDDTSPSLAGTPEVRPPSDLQGPGWAFASTRVPVAPNDEALHEEARRLARLLVSEIKLYNEEQVEEGRRKRDVYERLREDIDRSRQMYEERVEPRILKTTDYFYQELVRILAAGDARALGI